MCVCVGGGGGGEYTLPTEGDTALVAFNYSVACYIHQCRNNGLHHRGDEGGHHRPYIYIYIYTYNYHHCGPPPHSASCSSSSGVSEPVGGGKDHQHKLQWVTLPLVPGLFVPMAEGKRDQCQLQLVTTTMHASGVRALVDRSITPQVQGTKVRAQGAKVRTEGAKVRISISTSR